MRAAWLALLATGCTNGTTLGQPQPLVQERFAENAFGGDDRPLTLTGEALVLDGRGFDAVEDHLVAVRLFDEVDGAQLEAGTSPVANGRFAVVFEHVLEIGGAYRLAWFADADLDDACDGTAAEPSWSRAIEDVTGPVLLVVDPSARDTSACADFPAPVSR